MKFRLKLILSILVVLIILDVVLYIYSYTKIPLLEANAVIMGLTLAYWDEIKEWIWAKEKRSD